MIARQPIPVPILTLRRGSAGCLAWPKFLLLFWLLILSGSALAQAPVDPATVVAEPEPEISPQVAEEIPLYRSRSERDNQLLAKAAAEEVRWLDTPGEQALALFRPVATRTRKGALLLLHAAETPPGWPPALENARRTLPQHGWVTLALALPSKSPRLLPQRDPVASAEEVEQPETAEADTAAVEPVATGEESAPANIIAAPVPNRAEVIAQRLEAAFAWLAQEEHAPVFVLIDNSSVVDSLAYLRTLTNNPMAAMILVNLQAQEELTPAKLEAIFTPNSPPILDVFFAPEQGQMTATRKNHRAVALRNNLPVYQQLHLPPQLPATLDDEKSFWVERMRGFMEQQSRAKKGG